jgi:hypothetical protein
MSIFVYQMKDIMDKDLPDSWKVMISQKIENNLFSKVHFYVKFIPVLHEFEPEQ